MCAHMVTKCLHVHSLFGYYSLQFQVILFLRQKLVERYIGVDGVNFDTLGHLDTERDTGSRGRKGRQ